MLTGANICGKNISPDFRAERPLRGGELLVAGIADDVEGPGRLPPPNRHHPAHAAVQAAAPRQRAVGAERRVGRGPGSRRRS